MANIIDTRPPWVDIKHYAGDTLVFNLEIDSNYSTATWTGQIRLDHADASVDATFTIEPHITGATVTLSDEDSTMLNDSGVSVTEDGYTFKRYSGIFDIQYDDNGEVHTVIRGSIIIDEDITRV